MGWVPPKAPVIMSNPPHRPIHPIPDLPPTLTFGHGPLMVLPPAPDVRRLVNPQREYEGLFILRLAVRLRRLWRELRHWTF